MNSFTISFQKGVIGFLFVSLSHFTWGQTGFRKAKIVRNCTGTYLRVAGENHLVCNAEILNDWEDNKTVKVQTRNLTTCAPPDGEICALYFDYKNVVEITQIKMRRKRIE
jgi:hypothetical protein